MGYEKHREGSSPLFVYEVGALLIYAGMIARGRQEKSISCKLLF
jgi:hypothetical protein